jgi:hypothetical protein
MTASPDPTPNGPSPNFDSSDCVDLVFDGPGDTTVRPLRPELMKLALEERERIARWRQEAAEEAAREAQERKNSGQ